MQVMMRLMYDSFLRLFHWCIASDGYEYWNNSDADWFDLITTENF